jgi:hypothetical protein
VPETPEALFTRVQREGLRMPPVEDWLPPTPEGVWRSNLEIVARALNE